MFILHSSLYCYHCYFNILDFVSETYMYRYTEILYMYDRPTVLIFRKTHDLKKRNTLVSILLNYINSMFGLL